MPKVDKMVDRLLMARRILVLGSSGSGKTHLTLQLSPLLDLEAIHLDAHFWSPGWIASERADWEARVSELVRRPSWIMDGCFERSLPLRLPSADLVILMESRRLGCLWRIVKRRLFSADENRPDAPPGQRIDWGGVRYILRYPMMCRPFIKRCLEEFGPAEIISLQGPAAGRKLVQRLRERRAATTDASELPLPMRENPQDQPVNSGAPQRERRLTS